MFVNFKAQKNDFNLNIKPENVISTATITSIKTEPEEKEEIEKNIEKLNQKLEKRGQRKKKLIEDRKHKTNGKFKIKNNIINIL